MRLFRIILLTFCVAFVILNPATYNAKSTPFPDISGHWAADYVSALYEKGSISGMPDGLFHPNDKMTFPQFVTIIIAGEFGKQTPINKHWASGYMQLALEKGMLEPDDLEEFGEITRYDAARLAFNALTILLEEEPDYYVTEESDFIDFSGCRSCQTMYSYARQCRVKGIVTGRSTVDGFVFDGSNTLTRAEGCVIIMKMLNPELRTPFVPSAGM